MRLKLDELEPTNEELIAFISSKISESYKSYSEIMHMLDIKYSEISNSELDEEYYAFRAKKFALESMSVENLAIACIATVAVFFGFSNWITGICRLLWGGVIITVSLLFYLFILKERMLNKSKKLVYYNFVLDSIEKELEKRKN